MTPFPPATDGVAFRHDDTTTRPWHLRDTGAFLSDLFRLVPCRPGVSIALVRRPPTEQTVLRAVPLTWLPFDGDPDDEMALEDDRHRRSELLRTAAIRLWRRRSRSRDPRDHAFVTVSVRPGRVVMGAQEIGLLGAWRYANHLLPVLDGGLVLVTEHGWRSFFDDAFGAQPALSLADGG